jgi:hypothetical protein
MHDEEGVVAEVTKGFCQKAEVAVPEKLVRANGEIGIKENFQKGYKMPKSAKRSRSLRFRMSSFMHQERRFRVKNHKLCKNKRR